MHHATQFVANASPGLRPDDGAGFHGLAKNVWNRLVNRSAVNNQSPAHSDTLIPNDVLHLGDWVATRQSTDSEGSSNLLDYRLHWEAARTSDSEVIPGRKHISEADIGFEHYLNTLHPDDVDSELTHFREQLLNRKAETTGSIRVRIDNTGWARMYVRRLFQFCPVNRELAGFRLELMLDVRARLITD